MPETKLDHLLQVTAPRPEWLTLSPIRSADRGRFDDHLAQASPPRTANDTASRPAAGRPLETNGPASSRPTAEESRRTDDDRPEDPPRQAIEHPTGEATGGRVAAPTQPEDGAAAADASGKTAATKSTDDTDESVGEPNHVPLAETAASIVVPPVAEESADGVPAEASAPAVAAASAEGADLATAENAAQQRVPDEAPGTKGIGARIAPAGQPTDYVKATNAKSGARPNDRPTIGAGETESSVAEEHRRAEGHERASGGQRVANPAAARLNRAEPSVEEPPSLEEAENAASQAASRGSGEPSREAASTGRPQRRSKETNRTVDKPDSESGQRLASAGVESKTDPSGTGVQAAAAAAVDTSNPVPTYDVTRAETLDDASRPATNHTVRPDASLHPLARLQREAEGAARVGGRAGEGSDGPHVDAGRFVGRVARAVHTAQERGGTLQIRLSPPELGSLRLEIAVKDGALAASLETDNATARRLLLDHLPALRDRLAEQNIRIERFDVDVRQEGGDQPQPGPQQHRHQQPQQSPGPRIPARSTARPAETSDTPATRIAPSYNTQINLVA